MDLILQTRSLGLRDFTSLSKVTKLVLCRCGWESKPGLSDSKIHVLITVLYYLLNELQIPPVSGTLENLLLYSL